MKNNIRLIASDLDGTLLTTEKELTPRTEAALAAAAEAGILIVPATGRFYKGMPAVIRDLPYVRYVITMNGAAVFDAGSGETIYESGLTPQEASILCDEFEKLPVLYDCYIDGWGYMKQSIYDHAEDFVTSQNVLDMLLNLRNPVPDLKEYILENNLTVQKMQIHTRDLTLRARIEKEFAEKYPQFAVTSSIDTNVEFNSHDADKGKALTALAAHLNIPMEETMAFGDGTNDIAMLRCAGCGVAMANAHPDVKAAADLITDSCDDYGVAKVIECVRESVPLTH